MLDDEGRSSAILSPSNRSGKMSPYEGEGGISRFAVIPLLSPDQVMSCGNETNI